MSDTSLSTMLQTKCEITPDALTYRQEAETYLSQWPDDVVILALEENEGDPLLRDCIFKVFCSPDEDWLQEHCNLLHVRVALQKLHVDPVTSS
jgi:hypothetical protein